MKTILAVLISSALFMSCSQSSTPESSTGKRKIAVIPKGTSHAFWKSVEAGAMEAGEKYDVEILWDGPQTETEIDRQRAILESMVNQGVQAVAIAPLDEQGMARPIQHVIDSGLPVVIFDSNVKAEGFLSFVATDNKAAGGLGGKRMVEQLKSQGKESAKLMMLQYSEGSGSTLRREAGFSEKVTEEGYEIVARQFTDGTPEGALTVASNMLAGYVEDQTLQLDGIFASNESTAVGLLRALERLQNTGVNMENLVVIGFDSSTELVDALREGVFDALVVQNPKRMGYLSVEALVKNLDGEDITAILDTGAELVVKERLDEPEIRSLLGME